MIVGTHGVNLDLSVGAGLSGATSAKMIIVAPNGVRTEGTATVVDTAKGVIRYVTEQNVFNLVGEYQIQAWVYFDAAKLLKSKAVGLTVTASL